MGATSQVPELLCCMSLKITFFKYLPQLHVANELIINEQSPYHPNLSVDVYHTAIIKSQN